MARVVIADDSSTMRKLIAKVLDSLQHEVVGEASDGDEAYEKVSQLKPDVVLLDVLMPNMNGIDALCSIKRDFPSVKTIICSVKGDSDIVTEAIEDGADYFLKKPILPENLKKAMDLVL